MLERLIHEVNQTNFSPNAFQNFAERLLLDAGAVDLLIMHVRT